MNRILEKWDWLDYLMATRQFLAIEKCIEGHVVGDIVFIINPTTAEWRITKDPVLKKGEFFSKYTIDQKYRCFCSNISDGNNTWSQSVRRTLVGDAYRSMPNVHKDGITDKEELLTFPPSLRRGTTKACR